MTKFKVGDKFYILRDLTEPEEPENEQEEEPEEETEEQEEQKNTTVADSFEELIIDVREALEQGVKTKDMQVMSASFAEEGLMIEQIEWGRIIEAIHNPPEETT